MQNYKEKRKEKTEALYKAPAMLFGYRFVWYSNFAHLSLRLCRPSSEYFNR